MRIVVVASAANPVFLAAWAKTVKKCLAPVVDQVLVLAGRPKLDAAGVSCLDDPKFSVEVRPAFQVHGEALTWLLDEAMRRGATEILMLDDDCFLACEPALLDGYFKAAAGGSVVGSYLGNASPVNDEPDDKAGFDTIGRSLWPNMLFMPAKLVADVGTNCVHRLVPDDEDLPHLADVERDEPLGFDTAYEFGLKLRASGAPVERINQYRLSPFSGVVQTADLTDAASWPLPWVHVGGMSYFEHVKVTEHLVGLNNPGWEAAMALHEVLGGWDKKTGKRIKKAEWVDKDRLARCQALLQAQQIGV